LDSAQALIIIALRVKAVENAVDHLQPKLVTVVTSQESLEEIIVGCSGLRQRGVDFKYQPLDEAMEIGEAFRRFDRVLAQLQRMGYGNRDIFLDATGGTTPLRVGAALAAMMRNVKIVHQRAHLAGDPLLRPGPGRAGRGRSAPLCLRPLRRPPRLLPVGP